MASASPLPPARYLTRARDLVDARYIDPLTVDDLAAEAGLSRAHFSVAFKRAFGVTPHVYLLTRRLERAAHLLRHTDRTVTTICMDVGWSSVGSFTASFRRLYGRTPTEYREAFPPTREQAIIPSCVLRVYGLPQNRTFREASPAADAPASVASTSAPMTGRHR